MNDPLDPSAPPVADPAAAPAAQGSAPSAPPAPPLEPAPAAAPPAAKIVLDGTKTEREQALERTLTERERRMAELEDENRTLKTPPTPPAARQKAGWLRGATFFHDDE